MMFQVIVGIQKVFGTQGFGINYLVLTLNLRGERNRTSRHPGHSPPVRMEQAEGVELLQAGADARTLFPGRRKATGVDTGADRSMEGRGITRLFLCTEII